MEHKKRFKILSVVVPAYNAGEFIRDNLDSFCIPEVIDDIEVLIINDGSVDNTELIGKEYVEKYPDTFKLFNKENGGHGSGINCGIRHAQGKYFKVVDADDWVEKSAFINLIKALRSSCADIVYSGFYWAYDDGSKDKARFKLKTEFELPFKEVEYNKEYKFDDVAKRLYVKMHNMTIKTAILYKNNIIIDENSYYVDAEYILYPIPYVNTILFIKDIVYYYRIGRKGQSVSIEKMQRNEKNYSLVINSLLRFYSNQDETGRCSEPKKSYIAAVIARVISGKYKVMLSMGNSRKNEFIKFEKKLKNEYKDIYNKNINSAVKILRLTNYMSYSFISFLVKLFYK